MACRSREIYSREFCHSVTIDLIFDDKKTKTKKQIFHLRVSSQLVILSFVCMAHVFFAFHCLFRVSYEDVKYGMLIGLTTVLSMAMLTQAVFWGQHVAMTRAVVSYEAHQVSFGLFNFIAHIILDGQEHKILDFFLLAGVVFLWLIIIPTVILRVQWDVQPG
jgi:magnesium-transporting ATPase (P-type)